jgi:hypothetical protein
MVLQVRIYAYVNDVKVTFVSSSYAIYSPELLYAFAVGKIRTHVLFTYVHTAHHTYFL